MGLGFLDVNYYYKGLSKARSHWVYGSSAVWEGGKTYIASCDSDRRIEVVPQSLAAWTGELDKDGVRIYTGDVIYSATLNDNQQGKRLEKELLGYVTLHKEFNRYIVENKQGEWEFLHLLPNKANIGEYWNNNLNDLFDLYKRKGLNMRKI